MASDLITVQTRLKALNYKSDPVETDLRAGIDGALVQMDWIDAMIARGYGYHVDVGTLSTPIVGGGAGDVVDADQPELVIDVPTNKTVYVLRATVALLTPLIALDSNEIDVVALVDVGAVSGAAAANGSVESTWPMRTNDGAGGAGSAGLTVVSAVTTNLTAAPTADIELFHAQWVADVQGTAANALWFPEGQVVYEPRHPLPISGQATIAVYFGGTVATSGFINLDMLVIPTSKLSDLA